ncbi:MAG: 23S rRNA (pseudouridine(1915)-N(3))-methyltransferase RlmH [Lachnospiraceae bacterium]|nr:23S rRNA (pseudouridine(1915)-N(3))-methyltransferase RlmH [Lachnospiraceae bacterium]
MKIDILTVGRIKEKFYSDAVDEYLKRLSRYAKVNVIEVKDEKTPDGAGETENRIILVKEGERLSKYLDESAYIIPLCIEGTQTDSEGFADMITDLENKGVSHIQFIIGGSLGIDPDIKAKGKYKMSFSKMTFPHQLMRVILLEQIYRAYRIKCNEPYHK